MEAKDNHRRTLEQQQSNMKEVWSSTKTITGFESTGNAGFEGSVDRANNLNLVSNRFDTTHPLPESSVVCSQSPSTLLPSFPCPCNSPSRDIYLTLPMALCHLMTPPHPIPYL